MTRHDALATHAAFGAATADRATLRMAGVVRAALWVLLAGNLVRLPALTSGAREAPVSVNDLAVLTVLAAGAIACLGVRSLLLDAVARRAIAFATVGAASAVWAVPRFGLTPAELGFSLAYLLRWLVYFGLYVVVVNSLRRADVAGVVGTLERVVVAFAAFGVVQSLFLPGFAQLVHPDAALYVDWDPQGHRLVSTILDPNFAGAFLALGFLLTLARISCGAQGLAGRLALLAAALLLTASRSSLLAAIVGAMVVAAAAGVSRRVVRVGAALLLLTVPAIPALVSFAQSYGKLAVDASALARLTSWLRALTVLSDHPVVGIGFNTYGFVQRAYGGETGRAAFGYSLDGGLLFIAVMTGALGLALYVAMGARMARHARVVWRASWAGADERALAIGTVAGTVAIAVHSIFVNSLLVPFIMEPLWVLWGLVWVVAAAPVREVAA